MIKNKFEKSVEIAKEMIENGGEIHRAEEIIRRINGECQVFALPSLIIAQKDNLIQIKRIYKEEIDLNRIEQLNNASRKMAKNVSYEICDKEKQYHIIFEILSYFGATGSFCIYFGGSIIDAIFAGIISLILSYSFINSLRLPSFSTCLIQSFVAGIIAQLPRLIGINTDESKIIIGAIMLLVPGLTVVNATRDIMNHDLFAGIFEFTNAIISALAIALGISGALLINKL